MNTARHDVEHVICAFCEGRGKDPFGLLSPLSNCQVCGGRGTRLLTKPFVRCAYCQGTGIHRSSRMTCTTCSGVGQVTVPQNAITCPGCGGSGREADHEFPLSIFSCTYCKGKGMVGPWRDQ